ncbi:Hypothetical predicted protein [Podarcis lilfordi]|uniref:Uncharacterized protein n=1 Tax=Podarcis lilfordi TaxID=74358 RepID=A0AA35LHF3_9SAUR|nr:Hypothetical predicted protein [Podarcis lilfordi]
MALPACGFQPSASPAFLGLEDERSAFFQDCTQAQPGKPGRWLARCFPCARPPRSPRTQQDLFPGAVIGKRREEERSASQGGGWGTWRARSRGLEPLARRRLLPFPAFLARQLEERRQRLLQLCGAALPSSGASRLEPASAEAESSSSKGAAAAAAATPPPQKDRNAPARFSFPGAVPSYPKDAAAAAAAVACGIEPRGSGERGAARPKAITFIPLTPQPYTSK